MLSPVETSYYEDTESLQPDGWAAFSDDDLLSVLRHYFSYDRRISLKNSLGLTIPDIYFPVDGQPSDFLEEYFDRKMEYYNDRMMVFHSEEECYHFMGMLTRGMPAYAAKVGDHFDDLEDYIRAKNLPCVFLTLSPWAPRGKSPYESLIQMRPVINRLLSFLQKKLGYRPDYAWVCEATKRGHLHYHIIFPGIDWLIDKQILDDWWALQGLGDGHGVYIESIPAPEEAANMIIHYVSKYLTKPSFDKRWSGLLGLAGKRAWNFGNNLRKKVSEFIEERTTNDESVLACLGTTNSNSEPWTAVGTMTNLEIDALIVGRNPPLEELLQDLGAIRRGCLDINRGKGLYREPRNRKYLDRYTKKDNLE